jgi:hypothetical protein
MILALLCINSLSHVLKVIETLTLSFWILVDNTAVGLCSGWEDCVHIFTYVNDFMVYSAVCDCTVSIWFQVQGYGY